MNNEKERSAQWFKLHKTLLEMMPEDMSEKYYQMVGKAIVNALIYLDTHSCDNLHTMDCAEELIFNTLKKDVEEAFNLYNQRVGNFKPRVSKRDPPDADVSEASYEEYGEYHHVKLRDGEYERLINEFGMDAIEDYIQRVDEYCEQHGKKYKNYAVAIRRWIKDDAKKRSNSGNASSNRLGYLDELAEGEA